jgi:hypothetical protein
MSLFTPSLPLPWKVKIGNMIDILHLNCLQLLIFLFIFPLHQ